VGASNQTEGEMVGIRCENPSSATRGPDFRDSTQDMGENLNKVVTELRGLYTNKCT
jgi:hypothetical protein